MDSHIRFLIDSGCTIEFLEKLLSIDNLQKTLSKDNYQEKLLNKFIHINWLNSLFAELREDYRPLLYIFRYHGFSSSNGMLSIESALKDMMFSSEEYTFIITRILNGLNKKID